MTKSKTKSFGMPFGSHEHDDSFILTVTVTVDEEKDISISDIYDFIGGSKIENMTMQATNLTNYKVYDFDYKRIRRSFSYMLDNLVDDYIDFFDYEPLYLIMLEEVEWQKKQNAILSVK